MKALRTIWSRVGCAVAGIALAGGALAQTPHIQVTEPGFKVFQFPKNQIPRIDGSFTDWDIVPDSYVVPIEEMWDDSRKHQGIDKSTLDIKVKVGWVDGLNRLYFYYEAYDNYWDFNTLGLRNDTYEIVVDADLSGGPHVDEFRLNEEALTRFESFFVHQNVHAQNYHIMTPPPKASRGRWCGAPSNGSSSSRMPTTPTTTTSSMARREC